MNESIQSHGRTRPRAQSLFEHRSRANTEIAVSFLDRFIAPPDTIDDAIETSTSSEPCDVTIRTGKWRTVLFICQPIFAGFVVFPLLILFWQAGWNFMVEWLQTQLGKPWIVLVVLYLLAQIIFLLIYLHQDNLYDYLHSKNTWSCSPLILQLHTFFTASTYIIQWVSMWTIWDRYTSDDWLPMLIVSIAALAAVIVLVGHPCDLVCAPFILSYDSTEYNIRIGSPLLIKNMNEHLAHFLNYVFYEYILSLLSILAWRGSYTLLDVFVYPESPYKSAGVSLLYGYPLYFFLMYTQSYTDKLCQLPIFIYFNYPYLIQNIRHLAAFFTCVLLWRGYWLLFDTYVAAMTMAVKSPYLFYTMCMFVSFSILSLMKTASSIHGPMSHMFDKYDLFPHYPHCYLVEWFNQKKKSDEVSSDSSKNTVNEPLTVSLI